MRAAILLALAATACAPTERPQDEAPPAWRCDAAPLTDLVGRVHDFDLHNLARQRSGARAARVIRPGDIVTMDYREDRLNIHLTAEGRVERFACG